MNLVDISRQPDHIKVTFHVQRLDSRVAEAIRSHITTHLPREPIQVVLDLSEVTFADSMGISIFLITYKLLPRDAPPIKLVGCGTQLQQVLALVNLTQIFDIS
jgi:anti-anti-sigma factor